MRPPDRAPNLPASPGLPDSVTEARIAAFQRDGVVLVPDAFDADWIDRLRRGLERNIAAPGPHRREYSEAGKPGHFFGDYCNWRRIPEYEDFARNSPAADIAGALMDSQKVNLFHEHVVVKEPGTEERTPWHHDQPYYCVDGDDNVSLWVPLDPVPQDRAVEFIRGSHRWGRWFTPTRFTGVDYQRDDAGFEPIPDIEAEREAYDIVSFALEPGDCAAFHFRTIHGAPGNSSAGTRRRAVSFRWTGDDARFVIRKGEMSPPFLDFEDCKLQPGAPLDSPLFPVIRDGRVRVG